MMNKTEEVKKELSVVSYLPYVVLAIYIGIIFYIKGRLPTTGEILSAVETLYRSYGYALVILAAIAEGTFLLGLYVPGSAVILLGAVLSRNGVVSFPLIILLGTLGLVIGYSINYWIGRYGWYHVVSGLGFDKPLRLSEKKIQQHGIKAFFVGYFHPSSASFFSTASGMMRMPFWRFLLLSFVSQLFWSLIWGMVAYFAGYLFVEVLLKYFSYVIWIIILAVLIWWYFVKRDKV